MTIADLPTDIELMSHVQLCWAWRFLPSEDDRIQGDNGKRLQERLFKEFGGFTPAISKQIGWGK